MTIFEWMALVRGVTYLWVAATSFSISQLYRDGYKIAKKESAVITRLIAILAWLPVFFFYMAITAFAQAFNTRYHEILTVFVPIFAIPVGILLNRFRRESTRRNNK